MDRRVFFEKTLKATAAGILAPEHLLKGRSMVSLCGIDPGEVFYLSVIDPIAYAAQMHINIMRQQLIELWAVKAGPRKEMMK